jgi:eukaryotic-like serine/threonine-protein kinase
MHFLTRCSSSSCPRYIAVKPQDLGKRSRCPECRSEFEPEVPFGTAGLDGMIRYHLKHILGKGGAGVVFRAWDYMLQREVALKVPSQDSRLEEQAIPRFKIEAKSLLKLSHPNICPILDVDVDHWWPYLVMPILEGGDLESWLHDHNPSPVPAVCEIVRTVALAMEHAHRHRVIHRDLKLSNIMLDSAGNANVTDFGFARFTDQAASSQLSIPGQVFGTIRYMSPEQLQGYRDEVGEASDIYSLGIVLFRLLTRRFPFASTDSARIKEEILGGITVAPSSLRSDLQPELDAVFFRAAAREVNGRFASMEEFAIELGKIVGVTPAPRSLKLDDSTTVTRTAVPVVSSALGVSLAEIPPGRFRMGDAEGRVDERPLREITLERGFFLGVYPVTQRQYRRLMGDAPMPEFQGEDTLPMECVTWLDAVTFCNVLSIKEGLKPYYKIDVERVTRSGGEGYRLPTEAEWEYACRAGCPARYTFGDDPALVANHAWFNENSCGQTHPVGRWPANGFCLHDMHGNVWEWCWDWYGAYDPRTTVDPKGPKTGKKRVLRGGSWGCTAYQLRSASRMAWEPNDLDFRPWYFGFRVARSR